MIKRQAFRSIALCAALLTAPAVIALPGCGGGGGGGVSVPDIRNFSFPVALNGGQTATLSIVLDDRGVATGNLVVPPTAAANAPRALPNNIQAGTYAVSGSIGINLTFNLNGQFVVGGQTVTFTVNGVLPRETEAGSYTISAGGQSSTGTIPILVAPTATPTPTGTPIPPVENL